jgi:uncharacterized protein YyaL (SSP411 family)
MKTQKHTNRLINETSPYLLQHAHNPVDWYPWGKEAFDTAKREDKPIFLSIGYSACHWCHVMEKESFENKTIADILNSHFVSIKVDREERPDLDAHYMEAVQMMTGRGGWPMSVFLAPDLLPFYGGTYFPPEDRYGMPGFPRVLLAVSKTWKNNRKEIEQTTKTLMKDLSRSIIQATSEKDLDENIIENAVNQAFRVFDEQNGGFSKSPKFPQPMLLDFLLRFSSKMENLRVREMVELTLDRMASGGIYDHLGGGFHRYSVDAEWLVPHFEKMLYDNALLAELYFKAYQILNKDQYRKTGTEILDYILHEMTHPEGGFYSTQDADSEGIEGKYFVWTWDEIHSNLTTAESDLFFTLYEAPKEGNWEGKIILRKIKSEEKAAEENGFTIEGLESRIDRIKKKLYKIRGKRLMPARDEKILTDWNGLMISAFCRGYQVTRRLSYLKAAKNAAHFILEHHIINNRLIHARRNIHPAVTGFLADYAYATKALLDLYETTFDLSWLKKAAEWSEQTFHRFFDDAGGFFSIPEEHTDIPIRRKNPLDTALPSPDAVALENRTRLAGYMAIDDFRIHKSLLSYQSIMKQYPLSSASLLSVLDRHQTPSQSIVIIGKKNWQTTKEAISIFHKHHRSNKNIGLIDPDQSEKELNPFQLLINKKPLNNQATFYICKGSTCLEPFTDLNQLKKELG